MIFGIHPPPSSNKASTGLSRAKRAIVIIALLGLYMAAAYLLTGTACVFKSTMGIPCPGCGLSRAYMACMALDFETAFFYHPLFWYLPPFALIYAAICHKYRDKYPRWFIVFARFSLILFLLVFAVRLVLYFPHTAPLDFNLKTPLARLVALLIGVIPAGP